MKLVDVHIKQLETDRAYYGKTLNERKMFDFCPGDYADKFKECTMLLEILCAVRDGKRVVIEGNGGNRR